MTVKEILNSNESKPPYTSEGQIWWASLGKNIGVEMNGKSSLFTRPILIFKKLSNHFYLVIPLSTKMHTGSWYVTYKQKGSEAVACLQQIRVIDYKRLYSRIGEMDGTDFKRIKAAFSKLYT